MPVVSKQQASNNPPARRTAAKPVATEGILSRIRPIAEAVADKGIKIALFGRGGTGKTTLAATFPKPMLIVICSGAGETRSLGKMPGVEGVEVTEADEMDVLLKYYEESGKYKTFVLDHATGFQDVVLKKVLGLSQAPAQLSWGTATQEQWGWVASGMKEKLRAMLQLPGDTVILCQERSSNENTNSDILLPSVNCALSPSITGWLGPSVDYLAQTFIRMGTKIQKTKVGDVEIETPLPTGEAEFCLRIGPHPVFATKFRKPKNVAIPDVIVNPDYAKLVKLING